MEYNLENVVQGAILGEEGAVIVNLPHPARYALHKLLIYGERRGSFVQKARKDLLQAAALLACFRERRAREIEEAWSDLVSRGRGWTSRARQGLASLAKLAPELEVESWLRIPRAAAPRGRGGAKRRARRARR